jgi:hypothetical protein
MIVSFCWWVYLESCFGKNTHHMDLSFYDMFLAGKKGD